MSFKGFVSACIMLLSCAAFSSSLHAGLSYFLVAERPGVTVHGDSFVVPLSDPTHVAHARDLIARGPDVAGESILFAGIAAGSGEGVNRDLLAPNQHEWNWHVTNVNGFGDVGIEILDGWPGYVDQHLDEWIQQTNGQVGFWNYTIVQELPNYDPARPPVVPSPASVWSGGIVLVGMGVWRWRAAKARLAVH